jgi:hypothetical protein
MIQLATIVVFFTAAGITAFNSRHAWLRVLFLALFVFLVFVPGLTGNTVWPFFSWHLYGIPQTEEFEYYEIRVSDAAGNALKYDARAVRPSMATPLRRYAAQIAQAPTAEQTELMRFFLTEAQIYQQEVRNNDGGFYKNLKFPDHQYGYRWTKSTIDQMGNIETIVIYKVEANLSSDGQAIESLKREFVLSYP